MVWCGVVCCNGQASFSWCIPALCPEFLGEAGLIKSPLNHRLFIILNKISSLLYECSCVSETVHTLSLAIYCTWRNIMLLYHLDEIKTWANGMFLLPAYLRNGLTVWHWHWNITFVMMVLMTDFYIILATAYSISAWLCIFSCMLHCYRKCPMNITARRNNIIIEALSTLDS